MSELALIPPSLPVGWCPTSEQDRATTYFNRAAALLPQGVGYVVKPSQTAPTAAERANTIWLKLDGSNRPVGYFLYAGGYWSWPHAITAASAFRSLWIGVESDLWAMDGGDGTDPTSASPTSYTGAMWQVDHDFDFRALMGPGTSPDSTSLAVAANAGAEFTTLTVDNLKHQHPFGARINGNNDDAEFLTGTSVSIASTIAREVEGDSGDPSETATTTADLITALGIAAQDADETSTAISRIPPVRGIYVIKRTARVYMTA